ncbi:Hint domain-containing protein [Methylobacterium aquaticum]|uniref:Hedgehog/Intein (Hint) domain-containing protein n=1 Tax=Methylobacterium aquaticum TaxID=270351 RepID=A0A0J6S0K2_9HYPH|nr:hypothetical protein VP06_26590 [Methylobacterium aquaticum]
MVFQLDFTSNAARGPVTGTRLRTSRGEVAVAALRVGDRAVTASGDLRPVTGIGRRHAGRRAHPSSALSSMRVMAIAIMPRS